MPDIPASARWISSTWATRSARRSRWNPSQYQIYGFFGCSSYGYYNLSYFASKASTADPDGTSNTDIITNGITGSF